MSRIRSIKPELPQSETLGRVSRDARLLFVLLFTIVDDAGRVRAAPRMLAGVLFPYDDDAADLVPGWLAELETVGAIRLYAVSGTHYLDIPRFLDHQKIDRPSKPKCPGFDEGSRVSRETVASVSRGLAQSSPPDRIGGDRKGYIRANPPQFDTPAEEQNKTAPAKRSPGRPSRGSLPDGFPEFWTAYPRKVNKPAALRAWSKLAPDENLRRAIVLAVERAKASSDWQRDDGKYIPHPASWLNGERWADELDVAAIGGEEFNAANNFGMPPGAHPIDAGADSPQYRAYQRARFSA